MLIAVSASPHLGVGPSVRATTDRPTPRRLLDTQHSSSTVFYIKSLKPLLQEGFFFRVNLLFASFVFHPVFLHCVTPNCLFHFILLWRDFRTNSCRQHYVVEGKEVFDLVSCCLQRHRTSVIRPLVVFKCVHRLFQNCEASKTSSRNTPVSPFESH